MRILRHPEPMQSDPAVTRQAMAQLLADSPEGWARLQGLFAMLALPPINAGLGMVRRRIVEVEVSPNRWVPIEGAALELHRLVVWTGSNGSRQQYEFLRAEGVPRWRMPDSERGGPSEHFVAEGQ